MTSLRATVSLSGEATVAAGPTLVIDPDQEERNRSLPSVTEGRNEGDSVCYLHRRHQRVKPGDQSDNFHKLSSAATAEPRRSTSRGAHASHTADFPGSPRDRKPCFAT